MKRGARSSPPSSAAGGSGGKTPDEDKGAGHNTASTAMLLSLVAAIVVLSSGFVYVMSAVLQPGVGYVCVAWPPSRGVLRSARRLGVLGWVRGVSIRSRSAVSPRAHAL